MAFLAKHGRTQFAPTKNAALVGANCVRPYNYKQNGGTYDIQKSVGRDRPLTFGS